MNIRRFKKPIYVDFCLTPYCNLKCGFCYASACGRISNKKELTLDDFARIFDELDELEVLRVGFEGGEPFLRDDIIDILHLADKHNFTYFINTNATLITDKIAKELKTTDVDKLCVSIDGPNPEINDASRGVSGAFLLTQEAVKRLLKNNINIDGVFTLNRKNKDHIIETFNYMHDLGIKTAVIMLLASVGSISDKMNEYYLSFEEWTEILVNLTKLKKENKLPVNLTIVPPGEGKCTWEIFLPLYLNGLEEDIKYWRNQNIATTLDDDDFGCTACKDNLCIDGFGDVYGCSMLISINELCGGNLKKQSLTDIWYNSEIFNKIRNNKMDEIEGNCKECKLLDKCQGGCRACAFQFSKSLKGSDERCPICRGEIDSHGI